MATATNKAQQPIITLPNLVTVEVLITAKYISFPITDAQSPAREAAIKWLLNHNMIEPRANEYHTTKRGAFWLDTILNVPVPVQVEAFAIPERDPVPRKD